MKQNVEPGCLLPCLKESNELGPGRLPPGLKESSQNYQLAGPLALMCILFAFNSLSFSQNDGSANTGLSFLKLGVSSRAISMGEAVVSNSEDASALHYNPGAIFLGSPANILAVHSENVLGIRTEYLAAKFKLSKVAFGVSVILASIDDIEVREIPGEPIDKFSARNFALGLTAAYKLNQYFQFGLTGKFIYEKIYIDNASGFAGDVGILYIRDKISAGFSLANFGSMNELRSQATKLPTSIRLGGSYLFDIPQLNASLRISIDGFKVLDGGVLHANTGAEFLYKDLLAIRAGYQSGYENKSLTTGIGIRFKGISLDYAFIPYRFSQGNSHTLTLGYDFY